MKILRRGLSSLINRYTDSSDGTPRLYNNHTHGLWEDNTDIEFN